MFDARSWKFVGGFLAIIALALAGLAVSGYLFNPERRATRELEDLNRQYAEDTYGGTTPEETLELFISALEAGDIELASKYFVVDIREEWQVKLMNVKNGNELGNMMVDIGSAKRGKDLSDTSAIFSVVNSNNEVVAVINVAKGPNDIWKIVDM